MSPEKVTFEYEREAILREQVMWIFPSRRDNQYTHAWVGTSQPHGRNSEEARVVGVE